MSGLYYEEFEVDHVFKHSLTRTVTEYDNMSFSLMTMNPQPLHIDAHFSAQTEWGKPLINSLFTLGLLIGMTVQDTTDRKSTRLNSSHVAISYAVFCLK